MTIKKKLLTPSKFNLNTMTPMTSAQIQAVVSKRIKTLETLLNIEVSDEVEDDAGEVYEKLIDEEEINIDDIEPTEPATDELPQQPLSEPATDELPQQPLTEPLTEESLP